MFGDIINLLLNEFGAAVGEDGPCKTITQYSHFVAPIK
jgi:hypothetical protein